MNPEIDVEPGELYLFTAESTSTLYEYHGEKRNGDLLFVEKGSGSGTKTLTVETFKAWRTERGKAIRVPLIRANDRPQETDMPQFDDVDPRLLVDENDPNLNERQRRTLRSLRAKYVRAQTLRFYVLRYDETPDVALTELALRGFISEHAQEAARQELKWNISASTLRRAIHECGTPDNRPLTAFLKRTKGNGNYWHAKTLELKRELIAYFWSKEKPRLQDAQARFYSKFDALKKTLDASSTKPLVRPTAETLRLWIKGAECRETYAERYTKRAASRRFRGQVPAITASRALQYVMFDDTLADGWAEVRDGDESLTQERPWLVLAVDVYTRMILGAVLTFTPPSLFTIVECLKQVVRPKTFLPEHLRGYKGADDGWGLPGTIIVDNAWQYASPSFQIMCEAAGIHVMWAAVKNPEFKCHVEHTFDLLNMNFWHRLPSGIPHKPHMMSQLELRPRSKATRTLGEHEILLWDVICSICHVETNSGIGKAPARAWRESISKNRRQMIDDVTSLDRLLGQAREGQLTTSGIIYDRHTFHDPKITTSLLNDLMRFQRARDQRPAPLSTGVAIVLFITDPADCGQIQVWNPYRRRNEMLPNTDRNYAGGLSWKLAKKARELADEENLAFHSEEEKCAVRDRILRSLAPAISTLPFREGRKLVRHHERHARLAPGEIVIETVTEPSASGMNDMNISVDIAAYERSDDRRLAKAPRRGGADATRKAARARAASRSKMSGKAHGTSTEKSVRPLGQTVSKGSRTRENEDHMELSVEDASKLLADLRANLK